ncbi:hypothetical protein ACH5RR_013394 [Cinchona calisaya]|uniref:Transferase, Chloramphenicol acetyltransferase-like domain protein n=1 Tax=Cinchona calisaya TaxID=153742 RepID=A0ABD3A2J9_9GENT
MIMSRRFSRVNYVDQTIGYGSGQSHIAQDELLMQLRINGNLSKDCVSAIDGTLVHVKVSSANATRYQVLDILLETHFVPFGKDLTLIAFIPFHNKNLNVNAKRELLKKSLSQTLTGFYPLAGKVDEDNLHVECNDNGAYYVEARVNDQLSSFLSTPEYSRIHRLFPFHPSSEELMSKTYLIMIQINIFDCGGIAISMYTNHKLVDSSSRLTFLKAWAAQARCECGYSYNIVEQIYPDFTSPSIFPGNPTLPKDASMQTLPAPSQTEDEWKNVTKRFVFDASDLVALKAKVNNASVASSSVKKPISRVMAATGPIWKYAMTTSRTISGYQKPSFLCLAAKPKSSGFELDSITGSLSDSVSRINSYFAELIKGEKGFANVAKIIEESRKECVDNDAEYLVVTNVDIPVLRNLIFINDTRSSDGTEVWVTLDEHKRKVFENDPELLAFASVDPSPIEIGNKDLPRATL